MDNLLWLLKQPILECIKLKFHLFQIIFFLLFPSPNYSFQNFIPTDELPNGAVTTLNPSVENPTRRITRRNDKNPNQSTFTTAKPSFERANYYVETRDKISNQPFNKLNRKQQRFTTNQHAHQTNIQPASHIINTRSKRPSLTCFFSCILICSD